MEGSGQAHLEVTLGLRVALQVRDCAGIARTGELRGQETGQWEVRARLLTLLLLEDGLQTRAHTRVLSENGGVGFGASSVWV